MNQPPPTQKQTGKRIVNTGEYVWLQGKKIGLCGLSTFLIFVGLICFLLVVGGIWAMFYSIVAHRAYTDAGWILLGLPIIGAGAYFSHKFCVDTLHSAMTVDSGVLLRSHANTADLPASDILVRASEEPRQEQQAVLLRAATETQERQGEQLVRASGRTE